MSWYQGSITIFYTIFFYILMHGKSHQKGSWALKEYCISCTYRDICPILCRYRSNPSKNIAQGCLQLSLHVVTYPCSQTSFSLLCCCVTIVKFCEYLRGRRQGSGIYRRKNGIEVEAILLRTRRGICKTLVWILDPATVPWNDIVPEKPKIISSPVQHS